MFPFKYSLITWRSPFKCAAKLFKDENSKFLLGSSLYSAIIVLAAGCFTINLSRFSLTNSFSSSKLIKLVLLGDSLIRSKEKKKVSKYKVPVFKQSFKVLWCILMEL